MRHSTRFPAGPSEWNRAHLVPGLCSITLRRLSVAEVVTITAEAALAGVEWDTEVHVIDEASAEKAAQASADAGLAVLSLGSSYRLGSGKDFATLLDLAARSGAPRIRVQAGSHGSADPGAIQRGHVVLDAKRIAGLAGERGLSIALECRAGTLTETAEGTARLLEAIDEENIGAYWQPAVGLSDHDALDSLRHLLPFLSGVHCFSWWPEKERLPLEGRAELWESVVSVLHQDSLQLDLMLKSVQDDLTTNVVRDADFLNQVVLRED